MTEQNTITKKQLLISGITCLILGVAVVVLFVLPAEFEEDPTGFGAASGLDDLASAQSEAETATDVAVSSPKTNPDMDGHYVFFDPADAVVPLDQWDQALPVYTGNNYKPQGAGYKTETVTVSLDLDGLTEYKAVMNQGDTILYSWVSDQPLYTDFHAHEAAGDPNFFTRYSESEGTEQHGAIVAPYSGQHGWFWLNIGDEPATIELTVTGYFDEIIEVDMSAEY